jgi:hypothetical protein
MVMNYPFPAKAVAHIPSQPVAEMVPENKGFISHHQRSRQIGREGH